MRPVLLAVFVVMVRLCGMHALGAPVLNEIMFHPAGAPEPLAEEWIELHNPDPLDAVDLSGWKITRGVQFAIPAGTVMPPGGYLVIAADVAAFRARHPGASAAVVGGWSGRLSNSGENIRLEDTAGRTVDEVAYADEGDWAVRVRGALHFGHRGWDWLCTADGTGRTFERRSTRLPGNTGQNWSPSAALGGTPGAVNSAAAENVPPLITGVKHSPEVPRVIDPILISCELRDEAPGATSTLHWRNGAGAWQTARMRDSDLDGEPEATIPPQPNLAVIEFYISATDGTLSRTWPAPARTSDPAFPAETFQQAANALIQVDNSFSESLNFTTPGVQPIYRLIMTAAERQELALIGSRFPDADSDARMNATFISHDGTGVKTRYLVGVRNRGNSSRRGPPNNYHVGFPSDTRWNGRTAIQLNSRAPHSQALGEALFARAGIATQRTSIVQLRLNGVNVANASPQMYGRYVQLESLDGDWAEAHFPFDPDGNLYRLDDHEPNPVGMPPGDLGRGEFRYEGENGAAYADTFLKETNQDDTTLRDVIEAARIVSAPPAGGSAAQPSIPDDLYPAEVAKAFDVDDFYTYIATDALIGNQEGGLQSGRFDDASIYIGRIDKRVRWIPHDLDDVFDIGVESGNPVTRSIFSYDVEGGGLQGLARLFHHPQLVPRYYAKLLEQMDEWFNSATIDPLVEQLLGGWVPATDASPSPPNTSLAEIKAYVAARRANVLSQIQQSYSLNITTAEPDSAEGYQSTMNGAATISGTFNVAKTYSIRVNGVAPQVFYRTSGADLAGTWRLTVPAGGGSVLRPGLNAVNVEFFAQPEGTGQVLQRLTSLVFYGAPPVIHGGTLQGPSALSLTAPADYLPGVPILVRVDLKDTGGRLDRKAWNSTATLTASNGLTLTPGTVTLYNGVGSALVTVGTGAGAQVKLIPLGGTSLAPEPGSVPWRILDSGGDPGPGWKARNYNDAAWRSGFLEAGDGDGDERTVLANVPTSETNTRRAFYFRREFQVADPAAINALQVRAVIDDGAIFYLNGTEILRDNLPAGAVTMTTNALSNRSSTAERQVRTFNVSAFRHLLTAGRNVLAVEVHNYSGGTTYSGDLSFDCELLATAAIADPGPFTLHAAVPGALPASKHIASAAGAVPLAVSGSLPAGETRWSGLVNITGDVTVPAGSTLKIQPGTRVLVNGTNTPGDTRGARIVVQGALHAGGTAAQPITITAADPASRWGQIQFANAQPSSLQWVLLSHAGHAPGAGHTNRGPMLRMTQSNVTLEDTVLADGPAKAIYSTGTCDLAIRRSLITRMVTGPELGDGISLLIEDSNIQEILPNFRESNAPAPDDEDCLYVHNSAGRPVLVRRSVFAVCGDDIFDCLGGPIAVEDSILRDGWDKGMSLLDNDLTITRSLIINCDKAIVPKSRQAVLRTTIVDRCTIIAEDHDTTQAPWGYAVPPSNADPDTPSTGLYTQNKSNQSAPGATMAILARNSIIIAKEPVLVDAPYSPANTAVRYSNLIDTDNPEAPLWPGVGNIGTDPLFVHEATGNYRLRSDSPARDRGDPSSTLDPDGTRADMGALPFGGGAVTPGVITWTAAGGPYLIADHLNVAKGQTLVIEPGTSVHVAQNKRITVNGRIIARGTAARRIVFSHVPGTVANGDSDPIKNGIQTGPPKWGGLRIVDSMAEENVISHCDFINAQGTSPEDATEADQENWGSVGIIRSWAWVDHCTWSGSHLRWCYGRSAKLTVTNCVFGDTFAETQAPPADFIAGTDTKQESLKVVYPKTDSALIGNPGFVDGFPVGGWLRVYYNHFHGMKGSNDVFGAEAGRVGLTFPLDCRYNHFHGPMGDEHLELRGDALIASNVFQNGTKDPFTSDTGYSSAISGAADGPGTTLMVARNLFFDLDHAVDLKTDAGAILEHNTIADLHADYRYASGPPQNIEQDVLGSVVNVFVPFDAENDPPRGDGFYLGYNLISNVPRLVSGADMRQTGPTTFANDVTTKIEFNGNIADLVADTSIGANHPGTIYASAFGTNIQAPAEFRDPAMGDYSPTPGSAAQGSGPGGGDIGWTSPEWAYIDGGPFGTTPSSTATFIIGGPGIVAYKWRLDGGAWSEPVRIGNDAVFPRDIPTVRRDTLVLNGLSAGTHTLEVLGMDFAGNWQDADPAKTSTEQPQAASTTRTWQVDPALIPIRLNEVLAKGTTSPDSVELHNYGSAPVNIGGWSLTDDPRAPGKLVIPAGTVIDAGGFAVLSLANASFQLDVSGDRVFLYDAAQTLRDSVTFGPQVVDFTIGRVGSAAEWTLCQPTLGAVNAAQRLGSTSGLRINEWLASGEALYGDDWIELANSGEHPVALAGLRLTDNPSGNPAGHIIPPLSFIGAHGYLKLIADEEPDLGAIHLGFTLDAEREEIALYENGRQLDYVLFWPQSTDVSMGRDPSTPTGFATYELPTAGLPNSTATPGYANALQLVRSLRITEIMYNAAGGNDYDFIELHNIGANSLDLTGVSFVEGIDFTFGSGLLGAGQSVIVAANESRFAERYGHSARVAGAYTGRLDNGGETLALQLPPPFDANILTFRYEDDWYTLTDGLGKSLVVTNLEARAFNWSDKATWTYSPSYGGDPDGIMLYLPDRFHGWQRFFGVSSFGDSDGDGVPNMLEFALGMDPRDDQQSTLPAITLTDNGQLIIQFALPENPTAAQLHGQSDLVYEVQSSEDLTNWTVIATKTPTALWSGTGQIEIGSTSSGYVPVTVRDPSPSGTKRYLRLKAIPLE